MKAARGRGCSIVSIWVAKMEYCGLPAGPATGYVEKNADLMHTQYQKLAKPQFTGTTP
jgi:hypothetical protein